MTAVDQGFDPATIDLLDGAWYTGDPHAAWRWMRSNAPVFHDERNDVYAVTRYDDVTRVERDPTTFSSHPGIRPHTGHSPIMIHLDPPDHVKRRKLVNRGFTPRAVRALEAKLHVLVDTLIDDVIERGECDFVGELASWLPLIVIADLLGFDPADRAALLEWSDDLMRATTATDDAARHAGHQAHLHYDAYIRGLLAQRRAEGLRPDDLLDKLLHSRVEGADGSREGLDDYMIVEESMLILIGGDETTRHVMTGGLVELCGVSLPDGAQVLLFYPSANRDASVFAAPDEFDVSRDPNPHLAFGALSHHFCPLRASNFILGIESMPVRFRPGRRLTRS